MLKAYSARRERRNRATARAAASQLHARGPQALQYF